MKKYWIIVVLLLAAAQGSVVAQGRRGQLRQEMMTKVKEAKWAFIIYRLNLDEARANKLLPVYRAYEDEKRTILKSRMKQAPDEEGKLTDEQAAQVMDAKLESARKILDLKEKYKAEFLKILTPSELLNLQRAEIEFAAKIQAERQKRKGGGR
jgi:hypothetical protein